MVAKRVGCVSIKQVASHLSERDWAIIQFIRQHRFATTVHIRRRFFSPHASQSAGTRACVRVPDRLLSKRILTRLERRIGGVRHGSASFVWCLDVVGDRLTRIDNTARR